MSSSAMGLVFLLAFALSQGVRDALFGNVFQSVSFLLVAALAFGASILCFSGSALLRRPKDFSRLAEHPAMFAALNVTTAAAWLSFFFGLKHLEPAVVATLFNGIGPLSVLVLCSRKPAQMKPTPSAVEWLCYAGLAGVLIALVCVVLLNRSGLPASNLLTQSVALFAVAAGGVTIAASHMIARWFNDRGVGSDAVMGTRFLLAFCVSVVIEAATGSATMRPPLGAVPLLALMAFAVVTIPSFLLQLGIARASPLAVNLMRSLGPIFVFAVQQFDGRLQFSGATLLCITGFCIFTIAAGALRAWSEIGARPAKATPNQACGSCAAAKP